MDIFKTTPHTPTEKLIENVGPNHVRVSIWPFEPGYAITFAHPLKRLMQSCTPGYAPVALQIDGVSHEFDSIRGITEDVAMLIVNLKNICFVAKDPTLNTINVNYSFNGPMVLRGSNLVNDEVDIVNKEAYLATIGEEANLSFSLTIKKSIGLKPSELVRKDSSISHEIGVIPLDAYFTPVKSVTYDIEDVLVEDNPNFEKIVFNIETNGQVAPLEVLNHSVSILKNHMRVFDDGYSSSMLESKSSSDEAIDLKPLLTKIDAMNLGTRIFHCLDNMGIQYIGELVLMDENEIKNIKNLGNKSRDELAAKLAEIGYPIGGKKPSQEVINAFHKKIKK